MDYLASQSDPASWEKIKMIILKLIFISLYIKNDENSCYQFSSVLPSLTSFSSLHSGATTSLRVPKVSSQQHLAMFLSLTTALNHLITMLNHSNNELPAILIIFTSRDFGHVIYILFAIWN